MIRKDAQRRGVVILAGILALAAAAAFWLPRWWENRASRQAAAITGAGSPLEKGSVTNARKRVDPGQTARRAVDAIGRPSFSVRTEGSSVHEIWTYYYSDGTMTLNMTDGVIQRISLAYGAPTIPRSLRPE